MASCESNRVYFLRRHVLLTVGTRFVFCVTRVACCVVRLWCEQAAVRRRTTLTIPS